MTVSFPDDLCEALERYRLDQEIPPPVSATVQSALQEYLVQRGYTVAAKMPVFRITPAAHGSDSVDVSSSHDRYLAEAAGR